MSGDVPGWYGKLPTLGDFASRRLPAAFITAWDDWLQRAIAQSRGALGNDWLDTYLKSPAWCFVLMPDTLRAAGPGAWGGVLMPSVDRVGRYFPLTLAAPLPVLPTDVGGVARLVDWLADLRDAALDALDHDYDIATLDSHLAALPDLAGVPADALPAGPERRGFANREELVAALAGDAARRWIESARGRSFWFTEDDAGPMLATHEGLPEGDAFVDLLRGRAGEGRIGAHIV